MEVHLTWKQSKILTRQNAGITSRGDITRRDGERLDGSVLGGEGPGDLELLGNQSKKASRYNTGLTRSDVETLPAGTGRGAMAAFLAAKDRAIWSCSEMEKGMKRALKGIRCDASPAARSASTCKGAQRYCSLLTTYWSESTVSS